MSELYRQIKKDRQIWKFSLYGLLKNLKFFEPYLMIYLLGNGLDLFQIGILYAVREAVTYVFEIPSGIMADHYGKKNELLLCFVFYMASFVLFFIGGSFVMLFAAMFLFGLGEAFRSGTHKAMILTYLEHRGWFDHKAFVYGRTRSFSLFGSSVSSFLSILLVLSLPATRWIFLAATLPYLLDFLLILSYPDDLNERSETHMHWVQFFRLTRDAMKSIFGQRFLLKTAMSSAFYDGLFKTVKDYIQPILLLLLALESETRIKITLGLIYGVFFIFSALASRNVYRLRQRMDATHLMNMSFLLQFASLGLIALAVRFEQAPLAVILFFILYVSKDMRRPIFVDLASDYMKKKERATLLSVESQLRAVLSMVFAPLFGWIADRSDISIAFLVFTGLAGLSMVFLWLKRPITEEGPES